MPAPISEIDFPAILRLVESDSPDLAETLIAYLKQPDPAPEKPRPKTQLQAYQLQRLISKGEAPSAVWARFLAQDPPPPPRFLLADILVGIYEKGTEVGRATIVELAQKAVLTFGLWGGLKRIYKLAEIRHDAEIFGVLAARFDLEGALGGPGSQISRGSIIYLRKRALRWLMALGRHVPELYPQFCVQILRHIPQSNRYSYFAGFITTLRTEKEPLEARWFPDAWKRSPDPLLLMLELCSSELAAKLAVTLLRTHFPDTLRNATPVWLTRLARRPMASAHELVVDTLRGSPELHQGKLRALGLHDVVISLLTSPSPKARTYAIEYARAHAQDLDPALLATLAESGAADTKAFAGETLKARPPRTLGHELLGRMLNVVELKSWAAEALDQAFDRKELPREFLISLLWGHASGLEWVKKHLATKYQAREIGAEFWMTALVDQGAPTSLPAPRQPKNYPVVQLILKELVTYPAAAIGAPWLLEALKEPWLSGAAIQVLHNAESLPDLDVEQVKGMVFNPKYRGFALDILGNGKLVAPQAIGLGWLLGLARRADPSLHQFAHRYLLTHMAPADFGDEDRLFGMATGASDKEPEPVRLFAQTYLLCHHPVLGPDQPDARAHKLEPRLTREVYTAARLWPALNSVHADVRRFAVSVARAELRRWGMLPRVYELAESTFKETRNLAYDALKKSGQPDADPACTLAPEELDPTRIFAMTESRVRSTREVAMELILQHYARLGGPERLAWLMESADRAVRLLAVRMLWQKHRPTQLPPGWQPRGKHAVKLDTPSGFPDVEALRSFLRRTLFGLPPGRSMEPADDTGPRRHLPASTAKRNAIEVVRDLAVEDEGFARLAAPVLTQFTGSFAKGEWQACLSAVATIRAAHPGIEA